jgi:hypothetical protein
LPLAAHAVPTVSFRAPSDGQTVSGDVKKSACEVTGSEIRRVTFFLDSSRLNTDENSPWNCNLETTKFSDGAHTLKAVAYGPDGSSATAQLTLNIQNSTNTTPNPPPAVSFKAPLDGQTVSGLLGGPSCEALASDPDGVTRVQFFLDSTTLNTEGSAPWNCALNTQNFPDGAHVLKAVATDAKGATGTAQINISIQNATAGTPPPATNAIAIATFESLGLYWTPPDDPGAAGCQVRYRQSGALAWKDGLAMWYDARNGECRGSLVHLSAGTTYEVEFSMPGQAPSAQLAAATWSETFPIAKVVEVPSGATTLAITEGGSPSGYVLYTSPAGTQSTIDVANAQDYNVTIAAPYVIVRGLALKGATIDGIRLLPGAKDVVIEDNDISGWGRLGTKSAGSWQVGIDRDSAIRADCASSPKFLERIIIQRNKLHHPRYTTSSWDWGHPEGPQAVTFNTCGGNHVLRYNDVYSSDGGNYFNDAFSGGANFSDNGFPDSDSDIYGNRISHTWDDGIEAEGGNRNVRIWGNYLDQTTVGIASTVTHTGPVYIFRNVYNRSRQLSQVSTDSDSRNTFAKSGTTSSYGNGRRYVLHNTLLQATQAGLTYPLGAGGGINAAGSTQPLTNTVSRNNILHVWKSWWNSISTQGGSGNDLDYDLFNGNISAYAGAEPNGIVGTPIYAEGHGWSSESNGLYQLAPNSAGYDRGARLPNFNDEFTGAAPDMGAHEAGTAAMRFGIR